MTAIVVSTGSITTPSRYRQLEGISHISLSLVTVHVDVFHLQMRKTTSGSHENITPTQCFDRASSDHIALAMIIRETARDRKQQPTPVVSKMRLAVIYG